MPERSAWSTLAAMGTSYDFLPSVLFGTFWGMAHACLGSTIALRRSTLAQIGGFEAFSDYLADDYEIGRAVRQRGLRVAVLPLAVSHRCTEESAFASCSATSCAGAAPSACFARSNMSGH